MTGRFDSSSSLCTHGYVLLQAGGVFGSREDGLAVIAALGVNLMVGDDRERAGESLEAALGDHAGDAALSQRQV